MLATQQIFLIAALLCFLTFLTLLSVAAQNVRGVRELLLAAVLGMVCNALYAFGRELPPLLAYEAANMTYAAASAALLAGYRELAGMLVRRVQLAAGVAVLSVLVALFHDVVDSFAARSVVVSLFQAAVCAGVVRTMLAARHNWQRPYYLPIFVVAMCALVTIGHGSRIVWVLLEGPATTSLLQPGFWSIFFLTGLSLCLPALAVGGLLMAHRQIVIRAEHIGNHDFLTGAASRKAFFEIAAAEMARAERLGQPLALLLVDMDHFKAINDRWGHQAGDAALLRLVGSARGVLRARDCVARLGGDEFALLLPNTDLTGASAAGARLQASVRHVDAAAGDAPTVTLSIGATLVAPGEALTGAMARADEALYAAKSAGRDRVIVKPQSALSVVRFRA
jgi:diguanylate cyclase (GGDEF)-like protein